MAIDIPEIYREDTETLITTLKAYLSATSELDVDTQTSSSDQQIRVKREGEASSDCAVVEAEKNFFAQWQQGKANKIMIAAVLDTIVNNTQDFNHLSDNLLKTLATSSLYHNGYCQYVEAISNFIERLGASVQPTTPDHRKNIIALLLIRLKVSALREFNQNSQRAYYKLKVTTHSSFTAVAAQATESRNPGALCA